MANFNDNVGFNADIPFNAPQTAYGLQMRARIEKLLENNLQMRARIEKLLTGSIEMRAFITSPVENLLEMRARIVQPTERLLLMRGRIVQAVENDLQMRARILPFLSSDSLACEYEVLRSDLKTGLRVSYTIGSGATLTASLSMRARIVFGDSFGLPCLYLVNMDRTVVNAPVFGYSARTERILSMKARIYGP